MFMPFYTPLIVLYQKDTKGIRDEKCIDDERSFLWMDCSLPAE